MFKRLIKCGYWFFQWCYRKLIIIEHDDVIKCQHFPRHWPFVRESTGNRWILLTKAGDADLWCLLWSAPKQTLEQAIRTPMIWDAITLIMTSLKWTRRHIGWCKYSSQNILYIFFSPKRNPDIRGLGKMRSVNINKKFTVFYMYIQGFSLSSVVSQNSFAMSCCALFLFLDRPFDILFLIFIDVLILILFPLCWFNMEIGVLFPNHQFLCGICYYIVK